jgi:hypothetical protein
MELLGTSVCLLFLPLRIQFRSSCSRNSRSTCAKHCERAACAVVEWRDAGFDFDYGVADGFEAEAAVGLGEDFAFDDAGAVADRDELHLVAGEVVV